MKLTRKEFEDQLALAKSMPAGEPRTAFIANLKSAQVVEVDKDGNETAVEIQIVEDTATKAASDVDKTTELDAKTIQGLVEKAVKGVLEKHRAENPPARPNIGIITAPSALKVPAHAKRARTKNFVGESTDADGKEITAGERAYRFGKWASAIAGNRKAQAFCHENGIIIQKTGDEDDGFHTKATAQNEAVDVHGGFLVPPEFDNDLIDLREQYGVFRQHARMVSMSSDTKQRRRRTGGLTAYFVGEQVAPTHSKKTWDMVSLTAKKLAAITTITNELREDSAPVLNIGDDLAGEIAYAFTNKEDECGFNGTGTSTYGGITGVRPALTNLNGTDDGGGIIQQGTSNTLAALVLADFHKCIARIPQYADTPRVGWYCHRTVWAEVMQKLALASGGVQSMEIINGARVPMFLGYPVFVSQVLPSTTAAATLFVLFGDLTLAADYGERRGTTIAFSEHATVDGVSVFETDELAVRGTERFDINVHDIGTSTAAGPIVGLVTGA